MGLSKQKSKTTTNQTTTPVVAPWMDPAIQGFTGQVSDFLKTDPAQYVAPASPLQTQAFDQAANLGAGQQTITDAIAAAKAATATPTAPISAPTAVGAGNVNSTNVAGASYNAPQLGPAAQAGNVNIANTPGAQAAQAQFSSLMDRGGPLAYMDPNIQAVVDPALAQYDYNAAKQRAALEAQGAGQRAFGGNRWGFAEGAFDAETGLNRASLDAQLRAKAYSDALQASGMDAQMANQIAMQNAGLKTGVSQSNASLAAQRALSQAGLNQDVNMANMGATNQFGMLQAQMAQNAAESNAARAQQAALANQQSGLQAGMFNAGNQLQAGMFNTQADQAAQQFNAQQAAADANRQLASAGLTGQLGTTQAQTELADTALTAQLGTMQQAIDQAQLSAVPTQLQIAGQLYGMVNPGAYLGQNLTGVTKSTATPGVGNVLGTALGTGLAGWAGGGFPSFGI